MAQRDGDLPKHIAIIMDGNGRWARERGLPRTRGHKEGTKSVRNVVERALELGIPYLTLYAFSAQNWERPKREVNYLLRQLERFLHEQRSTLLDKSIRFIAIGRISEFPPKLTELITDTMEATKGGKAMTVCLGLNYGGRTEIVDTCRKIAAKVRAGKLSSGAINEAVFGEHLYCPELPELDLLIRTGGERRVSNFLLWQLYYAEIYISKVYWPDFGKRHFDHALQVFKSRERRFGKL